MTVNEHDSQNLKECSISQQPKNKKNRRVQVVDPSKVPIWKRYTLFVTLVYLQLMCNFDSGVLASVVGTGTLHMSPSLEGWVASSVYLGHIVGCLITGPVLNIKFTQKRLKYILTFTMCLNALCAWSFAFASIVWIMLLTRFVSGVSSAFIVVYCPLWVDDYAPANRATIWMSVLQAGVPLGIVVGYMVTGLVRSYSSLTWQWAFYLQSFMLVPGALVTLVSSPTVVNLKGTHTSKPREESPGKTNGSDVPNSAPIIKISHFKQISSLFRNPLWLSSVFCLCSLYFVVTGLQLWSTAYLTAPEPIHAPMPTVVLSFGITCITAPVIGVLIGGVLMDISGGYSGNMTGATMIGAVCGYVAVLSASAALYMTNLWGFMGFVWIVLCTGGAVVPIMTGLSISCVPKEMRNLACSVAAVLYNLLGYFLGPLICGVVTTGQVQVEGAQPEDADVRLGMTIVLEASSISWICMLAACVIVRRQGKEMNIIESESAAPSSGITEVDVSRSVCSSFALPFHNHEYSDIEDSQDEGPEPNEEESHQVSFSNHSFHGTNSETEPLSH